jgi:hypothetical protein
LFQAEAAKPIPDVHDHTGPHRATGHANFCRKALISFKFEEAESRPMIRWGLPKF